MTPDDCVPAILSRRHDLAARIGARLGFESCRDPHEADRDRCAEDLVSLLEHLAESVARGRSAPLTRYVAWARVVTIGSGASPHRLSRTLTTTREVLTGVLPSACGAEAARWIDEASAQIAQPCVEPPPFVTRSGGAIAAPYLEALIRGEADVARNVVARATDAGMMLTDVYLDVFQPALREVGRRWQLSRASVAEAHHVASSTELFAARMRGGQTHRPGDGAGHVLLCTPRGELHELGLRMIADLLADRGWETSYLGASCPAARVLAEIRMKRPDILAVSVSLDAHVEPLRRLIEQLRAQDAARTTRVLVGGTVFAEDAALWRELGADACATDARAAVAAARRLTEEHVTV